MRIAVPVLRGRVSPLLDSARRVLVVGLDGAREVARCEEPLEAETPPERAAMICGFGCDRVICGAVSDGMACMLASRGVKLIPWVAGDVEEVISAFAEGRLGQPRFLMPGCRRRGRFGGGGHGQRRGRRCQGPSEP